MTQAGPYEALDAKQVQLALIALMAQVVLQGNAGADVTPSGLMAQAAAFEALDANQRTLAELALLNTIAG